MPTCRVGTAGGRSPLLSLQLLECFFTTLTRTRPPAHAAYDAHVQRRHLRPDVFHTKPKLSQTALFEAVVRFVPPQLSWYAGYFCGAYALDMHQYARLFASTRIPKQGKVSVIEALGAMMVCVWVGVGGGGGLVLVSVMTLLEKSCRAEYSENRNGCTHS
jgi:hypothetical protein